jgi:hypothetical protein
MKMLVFMWIFPSKLKKLSDKRCKKIKNPDC